MKILIHDYPGHAFPLQLSRKLAERGHQVKHIYAGYNITPRGDLMKKGSDPDTFEPFPIFIRKPLQKYSFIKRWFQEREYGRLLAREISSFQPEIVLSANTPLDAQRSAVRTSRKEGILFVFWLQDVIGIASHRILREKIPVLGDLIGKYYLRLERKLLRMSDHIVMITEDFRPLLADWGINNENTSVIPNWAPLEDISPKPKVNTWSREHGLADKFCYMYTGTLGMKHNPELLLELANKYQEEGDIRVAVITEGPGADWLKLKIQDKNLNNLIVLPYQPFEQLPLVMAAADVLIALLDLTAGGYSVPSKVLSYLCAERPLLLAVPGENLAAKIVQKNDAGFVIPPGNTESFLEKAEILYDDGDLRQQFARNGRTYAENTFDIDLIADQFEVILREIGEL